MPGKTEIRYKFLNGNKSAKGGHSWRLNQWYKIDGKLKLCPTEQDVENGMGGFHASRYIQDALLFVPGGTLAIVEVRGCNIISKEKEAWEEMRVIQRFKWKKEHSVRLAIFSARLCLPVFESIHPEDSRPRKAIEAAEACLHDPSKKNQDAAWSAAESASWSATSATWSATSAAESATSAARAAASATGSAARSATSAAWSAASATGSAARSAAKDQIHEFALSMFEGVIK